MMTHSFHNPTARPADERSESVGYRAVIIVILALLLAPNAFASTIRVQRAATAAGDAIRLADVAELTGEQAEALGETVVARFGDRSQTTLRLTEVRRTLDEHDVHWGLVSLRGYAECQVRKASRDRRAADERDARPDESAVAANVEDEIDLETNMTLASHIVALIEQLTGVDEDELRIRFNDRDAKYLNRSAITHRFELDTSSSTGIGRVPVSVRQYRGDRLEDSFNVSVEVEQRVLALVVQETLGRGDAFVDGSVRVREVYVSSDRGQPLDDRRLVEGQRAASLLREGAVVYPEHVRSPTLVRRGELVTVRARVGGLMVRTVARASEEGSEGEVIQLRNEGSRETFTATVTGRREVHVDSPSNDD